MEQHEIFFLFIKINILIDDLGETWQHMNVKIPNSSSLLLSQ